MQGEREGGKVREREKEKKEWTQREAIEECV